MLLWAKKAGGGWIHARVGQRGAPRQLWKYHPPLRPPRGTGSPGRDMDGTHPSVARGQRCHWLGARGSGDWQWKGAGVIFC